MKSVKRMLTLVLVLMMVLSVMILPVSAATIDSQPHLHQQGVSGILHSDPFDSGCPVCGEVGVFMYDTVLPGIIDYVIATYNCPSHGLYQFYRSSLRSLSN